MNTKKNYIISYPQSGCTKDEGIMVINAIRWFLNRYNMQIKGFAKLGCVPRLEGPSNTSLRRVLLYQSILNSSRSPSSSSSHSS